MAGLSTNASDPANYDSSSVWGNSTTPTTFTTFTTDAIANGGNSDTAFVVDPLGTVGSTAYAGEGFNFDLAGAVGDNLNASATGADFLVDILPSL